MATQASKSFLSFGGCMVWRLSGRTSCSVFAIGSARRISSQRSVPDSNHLKECFAELGYRSDEASALQRTEVKDRFAHLARKYHPDTAKSDEINVERFNRLHLAYRSVLKWHFNDEDDGSDDSVTTPTPEPQNDIEHTAPQHRQFLEYGGVGYGTPFERQKHYQQYRASQAIESAREFSYEKARQQVSSVDTETSSLTERCEGTNSALHRDVKRTQKVMGAIERVAEDLIVSSMAQGLFDNLKGAGKPLPDDYSNPYVDEVEKRLNRILHSNGFVPSWILQEAEIRQCIGELRTNLLGTCAQHLKSVDTGSRLPSSSLKSTAVEEFQQRISRINRLIRDHNLVAPLLDRHFVYLSLDREVGKALEQLRSQNTHGSNNASPCEVNVIG